MSFSPGEGKQWHTWHKDRHGVCFCSFFLLYSHMYSATRWMISPLLPISFPERHPILQNIPICLNCLWWADEDINQICKYETASFSFLFLSSRGQKHFLADGSLTVSMYLHQFLNLFLHFLSRHTNITSYSVPLGNKSNLETW